MVMGATLEEAVEKNVELRDVLNEFGLTLLANKENIEMKLFLSFKGQL
jgi:hypothetical protein